MRPTFDLDTSTKSLDICISLMDFYWVIDTRLILVCLTCTCKQHEHCECIVSKLRNT